MRRWTKEQLEILKNLRNDKKTVPEMAEILNRTPDAVTGALFRFNLTKKINKWKKGEIEKLSELLNNSNCTIEEISKILNKKTYSVKNTSKYYNLRNVKRTSTKNKKINEITENEKAYIAGIIDGEGSIGITKKSANQAYMPTLKISNTDPNLINYLLKIIGHGCKYVEKPSGKKRACYSWTASKDVTIKVLELVYKYLVIKKEQADVIFNFTKSYATKHFQKITKEVMELREKYYQKIKILHHLEILDCQIIYKTKINEITETEKAYIAGIIDGEGNIGIEKRKTSLNSGELNPLYYPVLKISNTDPRLINYLISKTGNGYKHIRKASGKKRTCYTWVPSKTVAVKTLELTYNYLVIKNDQVDLISKFLKTYKIKYCKRGTPKKVVDFREKCYLEIKALHHLAKCDF